MGLKINISEINTADAEEVAWTVVECLAEAADAAEAVKFIAMLFHGVRSYANEKGELDRGLVPNPYFVMTGVTGPRSKETKSYLRWRMGKNFMATVFKWGGSAASAVTYVDVGTASLGAQALALTGAHAYKLVKLRQKYANAEFRGYVDLCLKAKAVKATSRGAETALALIPGVCIAATIGTAAAQAVLKLGAKVTLHKAIDRMAQLVHFHANLEQADSGAKPATELMKELFTRRGVMCLCQYDVPALVREPAGWMALADKLKLI